jgi:16S rRNA (cytosine967-C5)-methyltransferase
VRRAPYSRKPPSGRLNENRKQRPGLAARKTAARLLSAIVDAQTTRDGVTDAEGGHPQ